MQKNKVDFSKSSRGRKLDGTWAKSVRTVSHCTLHCKGVLLRWFDILLLLWCCLCLILWFRRSLLHRSRRRKGRDSGRRRLSRQQRHLASLCPSTSFCCIISPLSDCVIIDEARVASRYSVQFTDILIHKPTAVHGAGQLRRCCNRRTRQQ